MTGANKAYENSFVNGHPTWRVAPFSVKPGSHWRHNDIVTNEIKRTLCLECELCRHKCRHNNILATLQHEHNKGDIGICSVDVFFF